MNDMKEVRGALLQAFPRSFINDCDEFIAHERTNQYIILANCEKSLDVECKVLEWFSRPAHKGMPYSQEWRNRKFREFMMNGINAFLDTNFTQEEMEEIYCALGNAIDHEKTVRFIESDYDFSVIR